MGGGLIFLCSYQMICNHLKIIIMIIVRPHPFVINYGCHVDEIQGMKINTLHLVSTSSFTNLSCITTLTFIIIVVIIDVTHNKWNPEWYTILNTKEFTYNTHESKPKNIEMKTQTLCTTKKCINTKEFATHQHIMFSSLKSPKKDLKSQEFTQSKN